MRIAKIWNEEPLGAIALLFTIATYFLPHVLHFLSLTFLYADHFDIRCDSFGGSQSRFVDGLILQNTSCTITNNLSEPVSIVGIKPALFHNNYAYPEVLLPDNLHSTIAPVYLKQGEFFQFDSIYYATTFAKVVDSNSKSCVPLAELDLSNINLTSLRACNDTMISDENLLQLFYKGVNVDFYTFNKSGIVIQLGNGRELHYHPGLETVGFATKANTMGSEHETLRVPILWASKPTVVDEIYSYSLLSIVSLVLFVLITSVFHLGRRIVRKLRQNAVATDNLTLEPDSADVSQSPEGQQDSTPLPQLKGTD